MSNSFKAYAALEAKKTLESWQYDPEPLGSGDIEIQVTHNGLCHTDIHMRDDDWGVSSFPLVPGHEVVGKVTKVGSRVTQFHVGSRVGFGWIRDSCRACNHCLKGQENICSEGYTGLILGHHGGFADYIRAPADFAYRIPKNLDSAHAAPLLCAGITVYTPLRTYMQHPGMKVGVLGIGGLGHLAIKFAKAMGAEVTAFSTSIDKEREAHEFGAHHFKLISDDTYKKSIGSQELIINTSPSSTDWSSVIELLSNDGVLCVVGIPVSEEIKLPLSSLVFGQKKVVGSVVGGRHFMTEMLDMAATHQIIPLIETMPLSQVNEAMERVSKNQARYRIVLISDNA